VAHSFFAFRPTQSSGKLSATTSFTSPHSTNPTKANELKHLGVAFGRGIAEFLSTERCKHDPACKIYADEVVSETAATRIAVLFQELKEEGMYEQFCIQHTAYRYSTFPFVAHAERVVYEEKAVMDSPRR